MLYPDAEDADLGQGLVPTQVRWLVGEVSQRFVDAALRGLAELANSPLDVVAASKPASSVRA